MASLKATGISPFERKIYDIYVVTRRSISVNCFKFQFGIGSRPHDFVAKSLSNFATMASPGDLN